MNRNSHNLRGSSVNPAPRWRTVFIALVLVLAIGSAGQTPSAQAAPVNAWNAWFVFASQDGGQDFMCLGDTATFTVLVKLSEINNNVISRGTSMPGIRVIGSVQDQTVGLLKAPTEKFTGSNSDQPGTAVFTFQANGYGETTLTFKAEIRYYSFAVTRWIFGDAKTAESLPIVVKVIPCKWDVTTIGQWQYPGPGNISVTATSDDAVVKATGPGSGTGGEHVNLVANPGGRLAQQGPIPLTGSTTVNWLVTQGQVTDCIPQTATTSSQLDWTGQLDESGQLTLDGTYQLATMTYPFYCVGSNGVVASGSNPVPLAVSQLQVSVDSSGGVSKQSQVLYGPPDVPGVVTIIVVPVEDQAVAFNPDSRVALSALEWWLMLWDNFPWLNGVVLALR